MTTPANVILYGKLDETQTVKTINDQIQRMQRKLHALEINAGITNLATCVSKLEQVQQKTADLTGKLSSLPGGFASPSSLSLNGGQPSENMTDTLVTRLSGSLGQTLGKTLGEAAVKMLGLSTATNAFAASATRGAAASAIFKTALRAIPGAALVSVITTLVGLLAEWGVKALSAKKETENLTETISDLQTSEANLAKIQALQNEYQKLKSTTVLTDEQTARFTQIQNQLAQIFPDLVAGFDAEGNAIISNSQALRENIALKERAWQVQKDQLARDFQTQDSRDIKSAQRSLAEQENQLDDYRAEYDEWLRKREEAQQKLNDPHTDKWAKLDWEDSIRGYNYELKRLDDSMEEVETSITKGQEELRELSEAHKLGALAVLDQSEAYRELDSSLKSNLIDAMVDAGIDLDSAMTELTSDQELPTYLQSVATALKAFDSGQTNAIDKVADSFVNLRSKLVELAVTEGKSQESAAAFASNFMSQSSTVSQAVSVMNHGLALAGTETTQASEIIQAAFSMMGLTVNSWVSSMLFQYSRFVSGIASVADAVQAIHRIAEEELEEEIEAQRQAGTPDREIRWMTEDWINRHPKLKAAVYALGKAQEDLDNLIKTSYTQSTPARTGLPKSFDLWTEKIEIINALLEEYQDKLEDAAAVEEKSGLFDQLMDLYHQKLQIMRSVSQAQQAELDKAAGLLQKSLSPADYQKVVSGDYSSLTVNDKVAPLMEQYYDLSAAVRHTRKEIDSLDNEIRDMAFDKVQFQLQRFSDSQEELRNKLDSAKIELQLYSSGTAEYNSALQNVVAATQEYIQALFTEQQYLQQALQNNQLSIEQRRELTQSLRENSHTIAQLQRDLKSQLASIADEIITLYKEVYERQKQAALNALDDQLDAEERRHNQVMDHLDDELDMYEEMINSRLKMLEQEQDEHNYAKQLTELQKERQEILDKIAVLSLDDSFEARAKVEELREQLVENQMDMEEFQYEHTMDLRKENLQDLLDQYRKDVEKKKQAEEQKYEFTRQALERSRAETIRYYDNLIHDELRFAQIRSAIISGNIEQVKAAFAGFSSFLDSNMQFIGNSIAANLIAKMQQAIDQVQAVNSMADGIDSGYTGGGTMPSTGGTGRQPLATIYAGQYELMNYKAIMPTRALASLFGASVSWQGSGENQTVTIAGRTFKPAKNVDGYTWVSIREVAEALGHSVEWDGSAIRIYHQGGIVGNTLNKWATLTHALFNTNNNERIARLLEDEVVVRPRGFVDNFIPNMRSILGGLNPVTVASPVTAGNSYYLALNIDSLNGTKRDADYLLKEINKGLRKLGS